MAFKDIEAKRAYQRAWQKRKRLENPEKAKENDKKYRKNNEKQRKEYSKKYFQKHKTDPAYRLKRKARVRKHYYANPVKSKARALVRSAIASKKLIKPTNCTNCGLKTKLEGHHRDYLKPLEVLWLCKECHTEEHKRIRTSLVSLKK